MEKSLKLLKELTDANGVPGNEGQVRQVMKNYLESVPDLNVKIYSDNLGSFIAEKDPYDYESNSKIMIAGHMDEVGFFVKSIDDKGFIKFQTLGGWWSQTLLSQKVTITTNSGKEIIGIIGSKAPHILSDADRNKPADINSMFIDLGLESKEDVQKLGIDVGDMITPHFEFMQMANEKYLCAKAWDNRIGCAIALEVMENLKYDRRKLYAVGTVQEEVGLRGAKTAAYKINPDLAFVVDVGLAGDTPNTNSEEAPGKLGKGLNICLFEATTITHKKLKDFVVSVAKELEIPFGFDIMAKGGTDAGMIHTTREGVPTLGISIPSRYIHSHASMIHYNDYKNAVRLLTEVIKRLNDEKIEEIKNMF